MKQIFKVMLMVLVLSTPFSYIHELGHAIACAAAGFKPEIAISVLYGQTFCDGNIGDPFIFQVSGGLFAAAVAAVGTALTLHRVKWLGVALLSMLTGHGINAISEGFFNAWYQESGYLIMIPNIIILFIYLHIFFRKKPINDWISKLEVKE